MIVLPLIDHLLDHLLIEGVHDQHNITCEDYNNGLETWI